MYVLLMIVVSAPGSWVWVGHLDSYATLEQCEREKARIIAADQSNPKPVLQCMHVRRKP
jgi:hypothetical protein